MFEIFIDKWRTLEYSEGMTSTTFTNKINQTIIIEDSVETYGPGTGTFGDYQVGREYTFRWAIKDANTDTWTVITEVFGVEQYEDDGEPVERYGVSEVSMIDENEADPDDPRGDNTDYDYGDGSYCFFDTYEKAENAAKNMANHSHKMTHYVHVQLPS